MKLYLILINISILKSCVDSAQIFVTTTSSLITALANAKAGDTISLADGTYISTKFIVTVNGTYLKPITLKGSQKAILTTGSINDGYGFHLTANYWIFSGFSISTALKGIMLDNASFNLLTNLTITNIGT